MVEQISLEAQRVVSRRDVLRTLSGAAVASVCLPYLAMQNAACGPEVMAAILQAISVFRQIFQATEQIVGDAVIKNPTDQPITSQLNLELRSESANVRASVVDRTATDLITLHPVIPPDGVYRIQWRGLACSAAGVYFVAGQLFQSEHSARGDIRESDMFQITS